MTLLSTGKLGKYFGERCLFADVALDVGEHDKIGLIGANGCGKSTLFKILTGELTADEGTVAFSREARVGYMEQYVGRDANRSLWEETLSVFDPLLRQEAELEEINLQLELGETSPVLLEEQTRRRERFEAEGGLYFRSRTRAALLGLGFDEEAFSRPIGTLSGGQRSKVAMARLLLSDTNLLLLDEPTNHLDIPSVEWLEDYLRNYNGAFIVISHDRYFLDHVTDRTFEIAHGRLFATNGNYSAHRLRREKDQEIAEHHYRSQMAEIKHIEEAITRFKQFNREKSIKQAESKEKQVERLRSRLVAPDSAEKTIRFSFTAEETSGNEVLNVERLRMGFGEKELFRDVTFGIRRKDRAFLLGPNGCGKSTLLGIINRRLEPWFGSVREGAKVSVGYYDQTQAGLDESKTVLEELWDSYPEMTETALRSALAAFLFRGEDVFRQVSVLSGGERARLLLLKLMLRRDNFLLLDEPTNHLDIVSCEALEEALSGYDGTINASDWSALYPDIVVSMGSNAQNSDVVDYLKLDPYLVEIYEGYGFAKDYGSARGHSYTLTDVAKTARPHALANCLTCKTPNFTKMVQDEGKGAYSKSFDDVYAQITSHNGETVSCYTCHGNNVSSDKPQENLTVTHGYIVEALGSNMDTIDPATLACGQCHIEYYFNPEDKATTMPHSSIETMTPEATYDYYTSIGFSD